MNIHADELANVIFKKPLHECSAEELQQLVQQYPYFGPAHLLLTKKMQEDNSPLYEEQVQNTSLYFQNRVWLHHLLNNDGSPDAAMEKQMPAGEKDRFTESLVTENKEEEITHESITEKIAEQTETPVEIQAIETEPFVPAFTNETNEARPVIETDKEEIKEIVLPVEAPSLKIERITTDAGLIFEPYHTVDYFASQGIKYKEEEKPKDRFSAQLKSFTEWLKTMKRVPASEITAATTDAGGEKKVEQMAEYSLAERHVITEAMAEVWKKQGNKARAEDIYNKLSLLDPSKSSYFASKIDELKKTS